MKKNRLAVIGHPVKHSLSPRIHQHFATQHKRHIDYQKIDIENENDCLDFLEQSSDNYIGFNVTVPYKQTLLSYAKKHQVHCTITTIAQQAEAANTIAYHHQTKNHHTIANTDG